MRMMRLLFACFIFLPVSPSTTVDNTWIDSCTGPLDTVALFGNMDRPSRHYGIYIDAGSTGSRIQVYQFLPRSVRIGPENLMHRKLVLPMTRPKRVPRAHGGLIEKKVYPGVSAYAQDLDNLWSGLSSYRKSSGGLQALIEFAVTELKAIGIHEERFAMIPLYLGATAGVRNLPREDRDKVMHQVRKVMLGPSVNQPFLAPKHHIQVLAAEDEGLFGFVAANFYLRRLGCWDKSVGVMDMGGASFQITFWSPYDLVENKYVLELTKPPCNEVLCYGFPGKPGTADVFTHSWSTLGADSARARLNAQLIKAVIKGISNATSDGYKVDHPCYPVGYGKIKPSNATFRSLEISSKTGQLKNYDVQLREYYFEGASRFLECEDLHIRMLENYRDPSGATYTNTLGAYMPPIPDDMHLFAFGSVPWLREFLYPLLPPDPIWTKGAENKATLVDWRSALIKVCHMHWEDLQKHNEKLRVFDLHPEDNFGHLHEYCFLGCHILTLFHFLGIKNSSRNIVITQDLSKSDLLRGHEHGRSFNLGIGAMIVRINQMAYWVEPEYPLWMQASAVVFSAGLCSAGLCFVGRYLLRLMRSRRKSRISGERPMRQQDTDEIELALALRVPT